MFQGLLGCVQTILAHSGTVSGVLEASGLSRSSMGGAARTGACLGPSGSIWGCLARARAFQSLPRSRASVRLRGRWARASRSVARLPDSSRSFSALRGVGRTDAGTRAHGRARHAVSGMGGRLMGVGACARAWWLAAVPCAAAGAHGSSGWRWCLTPCLVSMPMRCASVHAHGLSWARVATCMRGSWAAFCGHMPMSWACVVGTCGLSHGRIGLLFERAWLPFGILLGVL